MKPDIIILAAGSSSRMGQPKQMLDIGGEKLLTKIIRTFLHADVARIVVVVGADEATHRELIKELPVEIVHNPRWQSGMGSSIKSGLRHLTEKAQLPDAVIVSVCDQPLLSAQIVANLIARYDDTGKPIIASGYAGVPGVPVLFAQSYILRLEELPDDQGAKKLIAQNLSDVSVVPFPDGEIDLDTMEDYQSFLKKY